MIEIYNTKKIHKNNFKLYFLWFLLFGFLTICFFFIGIFYNPTNNEMIKISSISWNNVLFHSQLISEFETMISGISLGIVGVSLQAITGNKLAGPTSLGFFPAILTGVYITIILFSKTNMNFFNTIYAKLIFSFLIGLILLTINFLLTKKLKKTKNGYSTILIGFALGVLLIIICHIFNNLYLPIRTSSYRVDDLFGNVDHINVANNVFYLCAAVNVISSILIISLSSYLNIVNKDVLLAKSLGIKIDFLYWIVGILILISTSSSFLMIGNIALLAMVIPKISQRMMKSSNVFLISLLSGLFGSFVLNFSYLITNVYQNLSLNLIPVVVSFPLFFILIRKNNE